MSPASPPASHEVGSARAPSREREPRLDFFRGLAMMIIMIAHIPLNAWSNYIPARFGPSDAAEMFVFCSGYAAAIAFGGTFMRAGWLMGSARILFRCWQIYWAHVGLFMTVVFIICAFTVTLDDSGLDFVKRLNLQFFFDQPVQAIFSFFTLTWIPNYFDILPMYFVILLMTPIIMLLHRYDARLVLVFCVGVWLLAQLRILELSAEPFSDRVWFFNPFGWQLLFFTGFAFARGWIPAPPLRWGPLLWASIAYVVVMLLIYHPGIYSRVGILWDINSALFYGVNHKTNESLLRYLHILALAHIALWLLRDADGFLRSDLAKPVIRVGQQALPTFMTSMALAYVLGVVLELVGRTALSVATANIAGLGIIIAVAYTVSWFKRSPWKQPRAPRPEPQTPPQAEPVLQST